MRHVKIITASELKLRDKCKPMGVGWNKHRGFRVVELAGPSGFLLVRDAGGYTMPLNKEARVRRLK